MRKWICITMIVLGVLLVAVGVGLWLLRSAAEQAPAFYLEAMEVDPETQKPASDTMIKHATALVSDVRRTGSWHVVFTAEQLNGWLAIDLPKNHSESLPKAASAPRVSITQDQVSMACRYRRGSVESILSLTADVYLIKPNVVGVRLRHVRAGMLPLPLDGVLKELSQAIRRFDWDVEWRQADGDPVAQITIPPTGRRGDYNVRIGALKLTDGQIEIAGATERRSNAKSATSTP